MNDKTKRTADDLSAEEKAEIAKRVEASAKKYRAAKARRDAFQQKLREGVQFFHQNRKNIILGRLELKDQFDIAYAVLYSDQAEDGFVPARIAYSIKAPTDEWNPRMARGLCGYRLKVGDPMWVLDNLRFPEFQIRVEQDAVREGAGHLLSARLIMCQHMPARVVNTFFGKSLKKFATYQKVEPAIKSIEKAIDSQDYGLARDTLAKALKECKGARPLLQELSRRIAAITSKKLEDGE